MGLIDIRIKGKTTTFVSTLTFFDSVVSLETLESFSPSDVQKLQ